MSTDVAATDRAVDKKLVVCLYQNIKERRQLFKRSRQRRKWSHHGHDEEEGDHRSRYRPFNEVAVRRCRGKTNAAHTVLDEDLPRLKYRLGYYREWEVTSEQVQYQAWCTDVLPVLDYMTFETSEVVTLSDPGKVDEDVYGKRLFFALDMFPKGYSPTSALEESDKTPKVSFVEIFDLDTGSVHYVNLKATKYSNPFDSDEKHMVVMTPRKDGGVLRLKLGILEEMDMATNENGSHKTKKSGGMTVNVDDTNISVTRTRRDKGKDNQEDFDAAESYIFDLLNEVSAGNSDDVRVSSRKRSLRSAGASAGEAAEHPCDLFSSRKCKKKRVTFAEDTPAVAEAPASTPAYVAPIHGSEPPDEDTIANDDLAFSVLWIDESHFKTVYESMGTCTNRTAWPVDHLPAAMRLMQKMVDSEYMTVLSRAVPYTQTIDRHARDCVKHLETDYAPFQRSLTVPCVEYSATDTVDVPLDSNHDKIKLARGVLAVKHQQHVALVDAARRPTSFSDIGGGQLLHTVYHHLLTPYSIDESTLLHQSRQQHEYAIPARTNFGCSGINPITNINTAPCIQTNPRAAKFCGEIRKIMTWDDTPPHWMQYQQKNAKCPTVVYATNVLGDESSKIVGTAVVNMCGMDRVGGAECKVQYHANTKFGCTGTGGKEDMNDTVHIARQESKSRLTRINSALIERNYLEIVKLPDKAHVKTLEVAVHALEPLTKTEHVCVGYDSIRDDYVIASSLLPTTFPNNPSTCVLMHQGPLGRYTVALPGTETHADVIDDHATLDRLCTNYVRYYIMGKMLQARIVERD
jgi:hypothetical protein